MTIKTRIHNIHGFQVYDCRGDGDNWWVIEDKDATQMIRKNGPVFWLLARLLETTAATPSDGQES